MNPLGVHALVFGGGWSDAASERAIAGAARCGFEIIEIPLHDPGRIDVQRTRRQLERAGIRAVASLALDPETDVSSGDPECVARGEKRLNLALGAARDLGSTLLTGVLYSARARYAAPPTEAGRWNCIHVLRRLAGRAAEAGLAIALEPVNRYESSFVNTAAQALALIDELDADNVLVHLDSFHMQIEESSPAAAIERSGPRLGYVHVGESHRGYLGTGTIDFGALFAALVRVGYEGPVTIEAYSAGVGDPASHAERALWRDLWSDADDLARHARQFMAAELAAALHRVG